MPPDPSATTGLSVHLDAIGARFAVPGGEVVALDGLALSIEPGSFTAVIGPNGCGKSTLLRVIAGLLPPSTGSVLVGDASPHPGDGRVGLAFQQPRLIPWLSTLDNVSLPLALSSLGWAEGRERASAALARVGLAGTAGLRPRQLSGGMAQRAALARAVILDPPVLLLDEPFSALDALTRETFNLELERLWLDRRCTVILVTHSVTEAVALADRVVVMTPRPGRVARIIEVGIPRPRGDVLGNPIAAAQALEVRDALAAEHALELRPWAEARVPA